MQILAILLGIIAIAAGKTLAWILVGLVVIGLGAWRVRVCIRRHGWSWLW